MAACAENLFLAPRTEKDIKEIKKDLMKLSEPISKLMESWDKLSLTGKVFPESEITQDGEVDSEKSNRLNYEYEENMLPSKTNEQLGPLYPDSGMELSHCTS